MTPRDLLEVWRIRDAHREGEFGGAWASDDVGLLLRYIAELEQRLPKTEDDWLRDRLYWMEQGRKMGPHPVPEVALSATDPRNARVVEVPCPCGQTHSVELSESDSRVMAKGVRTTFSECPHRSVVMLRMRLPEQENNVARGLLCGEEPEDG